MSWIHAVRRAVAAGWGAAALVAIAAGGCGSSKDAPYVAATCAGVCNCLAAACPAYPFAPDCVTACQDPTHPAWNLSCRASECSAAYSAPDAHCANAAGQMVCQ
jgi:hypothetical protein